METKKDLLNEIGTYIQGINIHEELILKEQAGIEQKKIWIKECEDKIAQINEIENEANSQTIHSD